MQCFYLLPEVSFCLMTVFYEAHELQGPGILPSPWKNYCKTVEFLSAYVYFMLWNPQEIPPQN